VSPPAVSLTTGATVAASPNITFVYGQIGVRPDITFVYGSLVV
jgi:hypothetical protein